MLNYLVTSSTRRRLLRLLWLDGEKLSVADAARRAGVAYAGAYNELKRMAAAGLATTRTQDGDDAYEANRAHPLADVLMQLLPEDSHEPPPGEGNNLLLARLAERGLPVSSEPTHAPETSESLEGLTLQAVELARSDATVARALPVFLARNRQALDLEQLHRLARTSAQKHALGFFLELTAELTDDAGLKTAAAKFRDGRRHKPTFFFPAESTSRYTRQLAELRTPATARRWGWLMNMGEDSFKTTLDKHVGA